MVFEVPTDLIRQVQISLRKDAGLSSYGTHDTTLQALPSLRESVARFDPSPPYLRCKHCEGRLLRGLQSVICVYCGNRQSKDVPPEPIAFKSTFGFQWLLQALDLDGSETVGPSIEENELNRRQSTPKNEISLSDLLNFKITWPAESDKTEHSLTNTIPIQSKSSLKLIGVDLGNFFAELKRDLVSNSLEEHPEISKQSENEEMKAFASQENIRLSQNVQHSETAVSSSEVKDDDTFSGWEADFQSVNSGNQHEGSRSFDRFVGSTVDLSAHMDSVFGPGKDLEDEKPNDASIPFASATNDGIQDDLWDYSNCSLSQQAEQVDAAIKRKDGIAADNSYNHSSLSIDWFPDDHLQTSSTIALDNKTISEDNDSNDLWNDFTTSTCVQDTSKNSLIQSGNQIAAVDKQTSYIIFSSSTDNFQGVDFDSFSQPGRFSGSFSNQNGSGEVNNMQSEGPALNRMADLEGEVGRNVGQAARDGDTFKSTTEAKDDLDSLLSQMTDLSFMLKSDLSVP